MTKYCEICEQAFQGDALKHIEEFHPEIGDKDKMLNFEARHISEGR